MGDKTPPWVMNLFIDDIRLPEHVGRISEEHCLPYKKFDWMVCRNYHDALLCIKQFKPQVISFDHDLGDDKYTGMDLAKALVELDMDAPDMDFIGVEFEFTSHSANPPGKKNIEMYIESYMMQKYGHSGLYQSWSSMSQEEKKHVSS